LNQKEINYITPGGLKKLTDELDHLIKDERPKTTEVITWAAALGDRSENADYIYAKKRLREIDRRLRFLTKRIDAAQAVDPLDINTDKVQFGATVKVIDEDGVEKTYSIVGADETNSSLGYISWKSPIGAALIGKKAGDQVAVDSPKGTIEIEVLEIKYVTLKTGEE